MLPLSPSVAILDHFSALRDPRERWRVMYPLPEILLLVLCATLGGMEDFVETKLWGGQRLDFLRRFLPVERGIQKPRARLKRQAQPRSPTKDRKPEPDYLDKIVRTQTR